MAQSTSLAPTVNPRETFREVRGRIALNDGREVIYRRARCDDEDALTRMFTTLTEESLYMRYIGYHRPTRDEIHAILEKEGTQEMSLVATPVERESEIVAQARCIFLNSPTNAEVAIVVHDDWQNQGLGTALMQAILACASQAGIESIVGIIGMSNSRMIHVFDKLGFATRSSCSPTVSMGVALGSGSTKTKLKSIYRKPRTPDQGGSAFLP